MKHRLLIICILLFGFSCQDDSRRLVENERALKRQETILKNIENAWSFKSTPANAVSESLVADWAEWRAFLTELSQTPSGTIGAFRRKATVLSVRAESLRNNIPPDFDRPEIRARISVLMTKVNALNLYINLQQVPKEKVIENIRAIDQELASLQAQFDEIVRRRAIPREIGEDMIRMMDTTRAIRGR